MSPFLSSGAPLGTAVALGENFSIQFCLCRPGATLARTGELVILKAQVGELRQVAKLRGNGACAEGYSQFA